MVDALHWWTKAQKALRVGRHRCGRLGLRGRGVQTRAPRRYLVAESLLKIEMASCTVVINCAGKIIVEFFSVAISAMVCSVRNCSATGCCVMMSAASPSFTEA